MSRNSRSVAGLVAAAGVVVWTAAGASAQTDVVTRWNQTYLDTVRNVGGAPGPLSRTGAMMSLAMYDAVNSIADTHTPYLVNVNAPAGANKRAAAAQAAHDVMVALYPHLAGRYAQDLQDSLRGLSGQSLADGRAVGATVAAQILAARANDGSNDPGNYTPGQNPGDWRPTWPDFSPPATPHWGNVTPFGVQSGSQFRPRLPPSLTSQEYTDNFNEIKEMGSVNSLSRTPDQTQMARFWANDANGTYKPPGHLALITDTVAEQEGVAFEKKVRLLALAHIAMADAGITSWDSKYNTPIDLWRPVAGVREAETDGNPNTIADPNWEPLNNWTPPFPAYVSGHSTFAGAHAAIMRNFFGTDNITFECDSDDPFAQGVVRRFTSFTQAAEENAFSRIYLGVHWRFDCTEGLMLGTSVGNYVYENYLIPIPAPGAVSVLGLGALMASRRRR